MRRHPISFEQLTDYVDGRLDAAGRAEVEAHLAAGCPTCAQDVAWLTRVLTAARTNTLAWVDPPPGLVRKVKQAGPQTLGRRAAQPRPTFLSWSWWRRPAFGLATLLLVVVVILSTPFQGEAELIEISGTVSVRSGSSDTWRLLRAGELLREGDCVRVEEGSAVVKTFDGSRINLQTGSELTLASLRRGRLLRNSQITVDQPTGSVAYDVAAGSQFNVGSPAAVVSAGGDTFELSVDPAGMSRLAVMDGQVRMDTASGSETVKRNEVIEAKPSEPPRRLPTMTPLPPTPPPARATETAQPPKATRTAEPAPTSTQAPPANKPTKKPSKTPDPTKEPTHKPKHTPDTGPRQTDTPAALEKTRTQPPASKTPVPPTRTATAKPTKDNPKATKTPKPSATPEPTKGNAKATKTPKPSATPEPTATPEEKGEPVDFTGDIERFPKQLVGVWLIDGKLVLATHETEVIGTPEDGREANVKALRFAGPLMRAIRIKVKAKATPQPTATSPPPKPTKTAVPPTPTDQPPSPTTVSKPTDVVKPTATAVVGKATRTPRRTPRPTAIPKQKGGQSPLPPPPAPKTPFPY